MANIADGIETEYQLATSYTPTTGMMFGGDHPQSTPSQIKRYVIHAVALTGANDEDLDAIALVARDLISITGGWMPREYSNLDGSQVETILEEVSAVRPYIGVSGSRARFANPFHRAFALLKAFSEYQDVPAEELLKLGMPKC